MNKNILKIFLLLSSIYSSFCISRGLFLGKEKCITDTYYRGMNLLIIYKILDDDLKLPENAQPYFQIQLIGIEKALESKLFFGRKLHGKFAYTIQESGKFRICLITNDKKLFKEKNFLLLEFNVQSKDETNDVNLAKASDFQKVNETMQRLNSKAESIQHMQDYQIFIEDQFADNQIKSSSKLAFLSVSQILIIVIVGVFHVISLRKIFKEKIWSLF